MSIVIVTDDGEHQTGEAREAGSLRANVRSILDLFHRRTDPLIKTDAILTAKRMYPSRTISGSRHKSTPPW